MRVGTLESVHPEQNLDELVVRMQADRLNQKYVAIADRFVDAHERDVYKRQARWLAPSP